jgi:uncharacterized RmlC-like cupin family protein
MFAAVQPRISSGRRSVRHLLSASICTLLLLGGTIHGFAQESEEKRLTPAEIPWPGGNAAGGAGTSGAQGIQTLVLQGDPTKPGLYTIRLRIAPNLRIQAHLHQDSRSAVVVSGTWYFGYGHKFDEKALKELPAGSFYTEPANVDHFAMTKGEVIVQITGYGPTSTKYFDAELDPARKK